MSADIQQVQRIIDIRGIDLRLVDGRLVARSRQGQMPEDIVSFIRHFKDSIVAELERRDLLRSDVA